MCGDRQLGFRELFPCPNKTGNAHGRYKAYLHGDRHMSVLLAATTYQLVQLVTRPPLSLLAILHLSIWSVRSTFRFVEH